jgi:uncharacterized protein YbaP (TraB family)
MKFPHLAVAFCAIASIAHAEPAIWQVQSPTAKIYLFGTMHLLPKHTDWLGPKIKSAFSDSAVLMEEADIGMVSPLSIATIMNRAESPDTDLFRLLPPKSAAKFSDMVHSCHLPNSVVAHFRPWFAAMLPTMCAVLAENAGSTAASAGPEGIFITMAKASAKKIDFFETAQQQIGYLADAPEKVQLAELEQSIDEGNPKELDAMEASWSAGDVESLSKLIQKDRIGDEQSYETIFLHRNERFAQRIEALLNGHETIFVAIGAGHLAGPDSVQAQLAKHGVVARRL